MKAGFLTPTPLLPVGFDRWQADAQIRFYSAELGETLVIEKGFVCDLDSIPRWAPILYALLKGRAVKESLPHDLLYRRSGVPRLKADRVMREAMIAEGQPAWVVNSIYYGLRAFGWAAYKRKQPGAASKGGSDENTDPVDPSPGA